ncbi:MAG: NADH-quinone oxidoreductase subunit L [Deltaproteobacteria bacterium]|nr:NADH-quinone oxidoreductase subunit L [Deltaproteobacteria bacterium]
MEHTSLFAKPDDWFLLGIILGLPLYGAFFNGVFGKRFGRNIVRAVGVGTVGLSFLTAVFTFLQLHKLHHHAEAAAKQAWTAAHAGQALPAEPPVAPSKLSWLAWKWMSMATAGGDGRLGIDVKFSVDELSGVMMLVVTGVGFLIHLYASSYMATDPGYHRFFAYLNLFIFSMLTLVLGDNLPILFVGWEGVGACSYLLIGFWFDKTENAAAGRKAFIANRIGDVGMLIGMLLIGYYVGALDWDGINANADRLLDSSARITVWQSGAKIITISAATAATLALFLGCTGKSAQIPLYVWLPDAMAGPTPVSALIHAATMVTSGIYLIARLNVVFALSPFTMMIVAITGALTALFAATIGLVQNDIKKVLAYSTVSQLGFMFLGVGVGAFGMGFFHVFTHAFFKACLFLGAGSVIHAMHARVHDDVASQDMRNMGGMKKYMPWTYLAMGASTFAIAGFPFTSGFFSKDGILFKTWGNEVLHPYAATAKAMLASPECKAAPQSAKCQAFANAIPQYFHAPAWVGKVLFVVGILAATMTAFYMFRLMFKTFWGDFRGWAVDPTARLSLNPFENVEPLDDGDTGYGLAITTQAHGQHPHGTPEHEETDARDLIEGDRVEAHDVHGHEEHGGHHHEDLTIPAAPPAEAPWQMTVPVAILGVLALFAGLLYAEPLRIEPMGHWLSPVFGKVVGKTVTMSEAAHHLEWPLMGPGVLAFAVGSFVAWLWYVKQNEATPKKLAAEWPKLHRAAYNKWYVDEIYDATVIGGADALADGAALMDAWVVDGIIAKLTALVANGLGALLRMFQTGVVHVYGGILAIGTLGMFLFFVRPHPDAAVAKEGDTYTLEAAPGIGYEYKWDVDGQGDKEFQTGDGALKRSVQVPLDATKKVTLEVKNSFGRTATRTFTLTNPKPAPLPTVGMPGAAPRPPTTAGH